MGIEWVRVHGRKGYTVNPIAGCKHECVWRMGDRIVKCYANSMLSRYMKRGTVFEDLSFHPERLEQIKEAGKPAGIFLDSTSDLFGVGVPEEWTQHVLDVIKTWPEHIFFSLTKNAGRLTKFKYPRNLWVGISAPATFMFGKELTPERQLAWFKNSLAALAKTDAAVRWVSLEPLSIDISEVMQPFVKYLHWAVVGAGSIGKYAYQPSRQTLVNVRAVLQPIPVFFKGNMDRQMANEVFGYWPEQFPPTL